MKQRFHYLFICHGKCFEGKEIVVLSFFDEENERIVRTSYVRTYNDLRRTADGGLVRSSLVIPLSSARRTVLNDFLILERQNKGIYCFSSIFSTSFGIIPSSPVQELIELN